ncbi:FRG domain-containing protein [Methanobrevibacter sp.]|uniref:FRG domain-containing protein n=1 Tax=Methanobrevibacter sp. TaxID=66852 RepID=UPI003863FC5C
MKKSRYIKEATANSYCDLMKIIYNDGNDLRDNFVFRGLEDSSYDLTPSALRKKNNKLNNFIGNDFVLSQRMSVEYAIERGFVDEGDVPEELDEIIIERDKTGKVNYWGNGNVVCDDGYFQVKKELYVLFKFLNFADRSGLKVTDDFEVRNNIHNYMEYNPKYWPNEKFREVISLAQHYGLPTRFLDWSYDYKSALYFALKDIVEKPLDKDGVLWAFNYKLFENVNNNGPFFNKLHLYRSEYNRNPNLQAQKGLFTFIVDDVNYLFDKSLDGRLIDELNGVREEDQHWFTGQFALVANVRVPEDEFLFYRITIPKDEKPNFLKDLYRDGYSEEYLFPGYGGAVKAMENRIKLESFFEDK